MVSKAALRSKATSTVGLPESEAVKILFNLYPGSVPIQEHVCISTMIVDVFEKVGVLA
jgi:hypothetical protein